MPAANPKDQKITLSHLAKHYSDEGKAYEFLEAIRWPNGPICPHCGSMTATYLQPRDGSDARATRTGHATQRRVWKCRDCRKQYSVLIGTIFEGSKIPLSKWLLGMHLLCAGKNGVSSHELARQLEITVKSAWFMSHRLRYAMEHSLVAARIEDKLSGTVEADETYVGGRPRYKTNRQEAAKHRMDNKTAVVSLVERGGKVRSRVMKRVTGENIREVLAENVDPSARLMTDESKLYPAVGRTFASHETVNHSAGEYVRGDAYTNTVEGYFSQLKRSLDGTHHHVSAHHLHRYVGEFDHRYNTREMEDGERTVLTIKQAQGKRLRYRAPQ